MIALKQESNVIKRVSERYSLGTLAATAQASLFPVEKWKFFPLTETEDIALPFFKFGLS
jgi:hypothetical protein